VDTIFGPVDRGLMLQLARSLIAFAIAIAVLLIVRRLALRWLYRRNASTQAATYTVAEVLRVPSFLWCLAAAIAIALHNSSLPEAQIHRAGILIVTFVIISFTMGASTLAVRLLTSYGERQKMAFAVAGLSRTLTHVLVFSIGALTLMRYLGLPITPMLATLGVGGLAVALALQDTLANFFAGVHILVERPVSVGDFIRLGPGEEGTITDIGWRTTRILTGANNMIVIPNQKITSGILTNFSLPDRRVVVEVPVVVGYNADPELVRKLLLDAVASTEDVLKEPQPVVLLDPGMTATHLQFKLVFSLSSRLRAGPIQTEVMMRALASFRKAGVPFPQARA
jgi:small-conductance mechanosensitive channel